MSSTRSTTSVPENEFWDLVQQHRPKYFNEDTDRFWRIVEADGIEGSIQEIVLEAPIRNEYLEDKPKPFYLLISEEVSWLCSEPSLEDLLARRDFDRILTF